MRSNISTNSTASKTTRTAPRKAPAARSGALITLPAISPMKEVYGLDAVAIAVYPMYRGLAKLVGMRIADAGKKICQRLAAGEPHDPRIAQSDRALFGARVLLLADAD